MTKAERLLYLANMIKNRGSVLVGEMAEEAGVSQRTIYRDLNSLSKMNIPIYYNNGYRLLGDTWLPLMQLSVEDMELLCYTLRNNPLADHPYFQRKFLEIEQNVVASKNKKGSSNGHHLFEFEKSPHVTPTDNHSTVVAAFVKAVCEGRKVEISFESSERAPRVQIPVSVKMRNDQAYLLVRNEKGAVTEEIATRDIKSVKVMDDWFNRAPRMAEKTRGPALAEKC